MLKIEKVRMEIRNKNMCKYEQVTREEFLDWVRRNEKILKG